MTTGPRSQCDICARFRSPWASSDGNTPTCEAFPDAIPARVFRNGLDHRQPVDGDHGLRWEAADGEEFPEWAFIPRFLGVGGKP
jgi:hypothetical protein